MDDMPDKSPVAGAAILHRDDIRGVSGGAKYTVALFVAFTVLFPTMANDWFALFRDWISQTAGWFYSFVVTLCLLSCIALLFGKWGKIRLGGDMERPEFSWLAWSAMLFAAGMGIGLVFWSVAEPLTHYAGNPFIGSWSENTNDVEHARMAMRITYFHWGLHAWGLYAIAGLIFAYFSFRKNEALTIRSALRPLIGDAVDRLPGKAIDVVAIVATVFGVATSLGFGAAQINAGLEQLFGFEISITHRLLIVAGITAVAVFSVASGLKRGIKILSLTNIWLAALILAVTLAFAPLEPILRNLTLRIGDYLWSLPSLTLATAADNSGWSAAWTTFYWGWWISWTPFVGLFIARISRGRTIREFVCGVLLIPTVVTFVWLSIMGGAAFSVARAEPDIIALAQQSPGLSLYTMIEAVQPGSIATAVAAIATILVALFFVTSADSGTLVVTTLQAGGDTDPPLAERVQWGIAIGAVAAALLLAGGLGALQAIAIAAALPFSVVLVAMIAGLFVALRKDRPPPA
ncbi:BCCT family transporter [Parasphingopyxis marina]|uniref:BCCT family transporter n=1 Tax=Parasphingopyxis marina TaxID=2761622 RepID=A0A842HX38_9SPHN|nr:BCCT family transporter [Parasphingopyxis marina]MBC2776510.1 BCCT family transporter [Parasphingopyxis marina]